MGTGWSGGNDTAATNISRSGYVAAHFQSRASVASDEEREAIKEPMSARVHFNAPMQNAHASDVLCDDIPLPRTMPRAPSGITEADDEELLGCTSRHMAHHNKYKKHVAAAKVMTILRRRARGVVRVEKESVYGAALAIPQIGRSCSWPWELVILTIRAYMFVGLNICLQAQLLRLIYKEQLVWDRFGGQMNLCNFGANIESCPGAPGCVGPGGTEYTPSRVYDYAAIVNRNFVRDSLLAVFPHMQDEIDAKVDPGEYGLESHSCRIICVFLFVMSLMGEVQGIWNDLKLIYYVPSRAETWVSYQEDSHGDDSITFAVAGMPLAWKLITFSFVLLPKIAIYFATLGAGTIFLMETSAIDDLIVNSMALNCILNIDELIFSMLTSPWTRDILHVLEDYPLQDIEEQTHMSSDEVMEEYERQRREMWFRNAWDMFPAQLLMLCGITSSVVGAYYMLSCERDADGTWISKAMYLPSDASMSFFEAFLPFLFRTPVGQDPYWTMSHPE
eukprot:TRINITY_DN10737_c0_g1_i1.p1 TRINITY_DN10737_c0_g1~~TRINITY_DN10737_c0_g1_i1.p1  ORF type:complete len:504 (+),score=56.66 TRINITY_DN10737_c0_g1_i1:115-1626(+)